jgi:putative DNA primase/helicase
MVPGIDGPVTKLITPDRGSVRGSGIASVFAGSGRVLTDPFGRKKQPEGVSLANIENDRHSDPTPADPPNQVRDAALEYAREGLAVLPLHSPRGGGCSCRRPCTNVGKHPRTKHGLNDATTDPDVIRRWWKTWPDANVAIRTGAVSKLAVLDVDPRHGGVDSLRALGPLPETALSETGGGGYHIAFSHPGGHVKTTANSLGPGLDIRADGGYIVAPPSLHASGKRYAWKLHPSQIPLAALPEKLHPGRRKDPAVERGQAAHMAIPEGARNATLASIAGTLRQCGLQEDELASALLAVNAHRCLPPLDGPRFDGSQTASPVTTRPRARMPPSTRSC